MVFRLVVVMIDLRFHYQQYETTFEICQPGNNLFLPLMTDQALAALPVYLAYTHIVLPHGNLSTG